MRNMMQFATKLLLSWLAVCLTMQTVSAASVKPKQVELQVGLGTPVMLANESQTAYLKVGLTGFLMEQIAAERTPVNVAIVLDRSGSMSGEKIRQAKQAAIMAVGYLNKDDIVSIVAYDDTVDVVVPATKVTDKENIIRAIKTIESDGSTALFSGVSKGAAEVQKFLSKQRVNRVILLSDGLANVGPSSPSELGSLGRSFAKEGISVTTIGLGLGYNEDLMVELAGNSDGNHAFVENATDLARIFEQEFGDVLSVVAQEIEIIIRCADGIRPVRVLGRDAEIDGRTVRTQLNQLYSEQEKYLLVEVEVPPGKIGKTKEVAQVDVAYRNMASKQQDKLLQVAKVSFSESEKIVAKAKDKKIIVDATTQVANESRVQATKLRDEGKVKEAKELLIQNSLILRDAATANDAPELEEQAFEYAEDAEKLEKDDWNKVRKSLKSKGYGTSNQQSYK